jgi:hypothetical protein
MERCTSQLNFSAWARLAKAESDAIFVGFSVCLFHIIEGPNVGQDNIVVASQHKLSASSIDR